MRHLSTIAGLVVCLTATIVVSQKQSAVAHAAVEAPTPSTVVDTPDRSSGARSLRQEVQLQLRLPLRKVQKGALRWLQLQLGLQGVGQVQEGLVWGLQLQLGVQGVRQVQPGVAAANRPTDFRASRLPRRAGAAPRPTILFEDFGGKVHDSELLHAVNLDIVSVTAHLGRLDRHA